mgnify:CR=1 FL=1
MAREQVWTVVRFPDGSWSSGGKIDSPEYDLCEKWSVFASDRGAAVSAAKKLRRNEMAREKRRQMVIER